MDTTLGVCYLHTMHTQIDQIRVGCEVVIVIMALYFLLKVHFIHNKTLDGRRFMSSPFLGGEFSYRTWCSVPRGSDS